MGSRAVARVLIVNTKLVGEGERPDSIFDLVDPQWKDRCGIAKPLGGDDGDACGVFVRGVGR